MGLAYTIAGESLAVPVFLVIAAAIILAPGAVVLWPSSHPNRNTLGLTLLADDNGPCTCFTTI